MPKDPRAYTKDQRSLGKHITTLVVGADGQEQFVHQELLCKSSPFFEAAAKKEWKEGQERRIPLVEDDPAAVALYVQWLYSRQIFSRPSRGEENDNTAEVRLLVLSYVLGEKLQDERFKDTIIDAIIATVAEEATDGQRYWPGDHNVNEAYEGTPEGSPLRRLLVDMYFFNGIQKWVTDALNATFLADLVREVFGNRNRDSYYDTTKWDGKSCCYHHHPEKTPCHLA